MTVLTARARSLADICADAIGAYCACCLAGDSQPCGTTRPGVHLARIRRARERTLISADDFIAVINAAVAFHEGTVICAGTGAPS